MKKNYPDASIGEFFFDSNNLPGMRLGNHYKKSAAHVRELRRAAEHRICARGLYISFCFRPAPEKINFRNLRERIETNYRVDTALLPRPPIELFLKATWNNKFSPAADTKNPSGENLRRDFV